MLARIFFKILPELLGCEFHHVFGDKLERQPGRLCQNLLLGRTFQIVKIVKRLRD